MYTYISLSMYKALFIQHGLISYSFIFLLEHDFSRISEKINMYILIRLDRLLSNMHVCQISRVETISLIYARLYYCHINRSLFGGSPEIRIILLQQLQLRSRNVLVS